MSYPCELKEQPAQPTLALRTRASVEQLGRVLGEAHGAIDRHMGELEEPCAGPPYAAYYNEDMQDLDIEIGFPVARELPGRGQIQAGEIPGGQVATCLHTGSYSDIEPAYQALGRWMAENGYEPTDVAYEIYLNDPKEVPPEELQTQIVFPLQS